jgi:hydroxypyruvate isomerase
LYIPTNNLRFAANLSMMYNEVPFLDRFAAAAASGFGAVEFLFPYDEGIDSVRSRAQDFGLDIALFNLHPGDTDAGEWGTLSSPSRRDFFRWSFSTALEAAIDLRSQNLNMMFGQHVTGLDPLQQIACAVENLLWAAPQAAAMGVTLLIEPLNPTDFPNYFLRETATALEILAAVNHSSVRLLYDVYHASMVQEDVLAVVGSTISHIGHIQIADVPGRHEPGTGAIDYPAILAAMNNVGYRRHIGLEYRPSVSTEESLGWLPRESRAER